VSADLASLINAEHEAACVKARQALEHAHRAGELLLQAKASVGHGSFLGWIAEHCTFSPRQAQRYMLLVERWPAIREKYDTASHLTLSRALRLIDRRGASELEQALALERRADELRVEIQLLGAAADRILADPQANADTVAMIERRAADLASRALELRDLAKRELERALIETKRLPGFTGLSEAELLSMVEDGSLVRAAHERIAELAAR
jgi:hypothetical protein